MPRELPEWHGADDNTAIPPRVRLRTFERYHGACQGCLRKLRPGDKWQLDHIVALINGGENRETNLRVICDWCHKTKTAADVAEKSRTYRRKARHIGIKKPRTITSWRKFNGEIVRAGRAR